MKSWRRASKACPLMRMSSGIAAFAVFFALLASQAAADHNRNYFGAQPFNTPGSLLPTLNQYQHFIDRPDFPEGGPNFCRSLSGNRIVFYEGSVYHDMFPHANGHVRLSAASEDFDLVLAIFPFTPGTGQYGEVRCNNSNVGGLAVFEYDVTAGAAYKVQVGSIVYENPPGSGQFFYNGGNYQVQVEYDPDSDGDGVLDSADECDRAPGTRTLRGCPDADGDGVQDQRDGTAAPDKCLGEKGNRSDGCLDSDGDGFIDRDDKCPRVAGAIAGCPDVDADGIPEPPDRCPAEDSRPRDKNKDGCLDYGHITSTVRLFLVPVRTGSRITTFKIRNVPHGATVRFRCRGCGRRYALKSSPDARVSRTLTARRLVGKRFRRGASLTIRVTKPKYIGKYFRYRIGRGSFKVRTRCIPAGATRPKKKCPEF